MWERIHGIAVFDPALENHLSVQRGLAVRRDAGRHWKRSI
jgi:hypothetical protein